jgi:hypothetical protein
VFDAFLTIYKWRIADLLRIATGGSGLLPAGAIHPDLVDRLAQEAAKTASHMLQMCIRALDYCPPVDVTFGDYLRALITADADLVADDRLNYRLAVIEAFRRRGIYPLDVRNLSEESLLWRQPTAEEQAQFAQAFRGPDDLRRLVPDWGLRVDRGQIYEQSKKNRRTLHRRLTRSPGSAAVPAAGLTLDENAPAGVYRTRGGKPALEIHSARPAYRVGPDGDTLTDLVVEMTQRRRGYFSAEVQARVDAGEPNPPEPDFTFRGGCTLLVSLETGEVRYCVWKRILSEHRLAAQRDYLTEAVEPSLRSTYFGDARHLYFEALAQGVGLESLALLHRSYGGEEGV